MMTGILATLGLGGLTAFGLASFMPALMLGTGGVGIVGAIIAWFAKDNIKKIFKIVAIIAVVLLIAATGFYLAVLRERSEELTELKAKVDGLETELKCDVRDNVNEHDLFVCVPALKADAEAAKNAAITEQQNFAALERGIMQAKVAKLQQDLADSDAEIDADAAEDGPLPKTLTNAWARDRVRGGAK